MIIHFHKSYVSILYTVKPPVIVNFVFHLWVCVCVGVSEKYVIVFVGCLGFCQRGHGTSLLILRPTRSTQYGVVSHVSITLRI